MTDQTQQTPGDGKPPSQTPTGEIKDQSLLSKGTETTTTETTPPPSDKTTDTSNQQDDKSLLNKKEEAKPGAPEKYEDYKLPDNYELDPAVKTEADTIFKDLGLSQEQAQKLVDFYVGKTTEAFEQPFKAFKDMRSGWVREANDHPDLKGKLAANGPVLTTIAKALDGLGDAQLANEFRQVMDYTGAGDHPAFIRAFYKMAQKLTEGSAVGGNGPSKHGQVPAGQPRLGASALFPNLPSSNQG